MFIRNGQKTGSILLDDKRQRVQSAEAQATPKAAPKAERKATTKTASKSEPRTSVKDKEARDGDDNLHR